MLTEAVHGVLTDHLRGRYGFDAAIVSVGMVASILGALVLASVMAALQLLAAARQPIVRLERTKAPPVLCALLCTLDIRTPRRSR